MVAPLSRFPASSSMPITGLRSAPHNPPKKKPSTPLTSAANPATVPVSASPLPVTFPAQVDLAATQADRETAHYTARRRLLRLMIQKFGSVKPPT